MMRHKGDETYYASTRFEKYVETKVDFFLIRHDLVLFLYVMTQTGMFYAESLQVVGH